MKKKIIITEAQHKRLKNKLNEDINNDGQIGISLMSLLDGELALASREGNLSDYKSRIDFIINIENRLRENDWISLRDGTTFKRAFEPTGRE